MKISSKLTPFKNFGRSLVLTIIISIAAGLVCYLSFKFLIHLGLTSALSGSSATSSIDTTASLLFASLLVGVFFYIFVAIAIIFSNLIGLLSLRLLKVDHSVKITIMSLIIILTLTAVYAMLSLDSVLPIEVLLIALPPVSYLVSIVAIKMLVDRNSRSKHPKNPSNKDPSVLD